MSLEDVRKEIDAIDRELIPLFCKRMECSRRVADIKRRENLPVLNGKREKEILERVSLQAGEYGPAAKMLYSTIMQASRALQHGELGAGGELRALVAGASSSIAERPIVACPGVTGSFSHEAALGLFPQGKLQFYPLFDDIFTAIDEDKADFGVIPVENSSAGSVTDVYDLLLKYRFFIVGATDVAIRHHLCACKGAGLQTIQKVYSHPQGLSQCSRRIKQLGLEPIQFSNTAAAAKMVAENGDAACAAICSKAAAAHFGLTVLEESVQNHANNTTRFVVISKHLSIPSHADKISLCFSLNHTTGSLYSVLGRFAMLGLNLTKIESRPMPGKSFEYFFYLDFTGSVREQNVLNLICALSDELPEFSFLGNYLETDSAAQCVTGK